MGYKKRPKNKQEIDSFSGVIRKKKPTQRKYEVLVSFGFTAPNGIKYSNGTGRLKISITGQAQCLIPTTNEDGKIKWMVIVGAVLNFIKIKEQSNVVIQRKTVAARRNTK